MNALRIAIATDAWAPQVNGVVTTLGATVCRLRALGHAVDVIAPEGFATMRLPTDAGIRVALAPGRQVGERLAAFAPDIVHVATEGPIGWAARRHAVRRRLPLTTAFHTRFPEYLALRARVPQRWTYAVLRRFHAPAARVLTPTPTMADALLRHGIAHAALWSRGVDAATFRPVAPEALGLPRPVFLYVGRLAVEKDVAAFLALDLPGSKVVAGEGPQEAALRRRFPRARFLGARAHASLPALYAAADAFVFPSRTDTFGLVLLEALACGTPVAALPVPGPLDVIGTGCAGVLDADLRRACLAALAIPRASAVAHARRFSWEACTDVFVGHMREAMALQRAGTGARL